jgi:ParB family chromosome partitioning protein
MGEIITGLTAGDSKGKEEIIHVEIGELHEFRGHTFQVRDDEEMKILTESIRECGIMSPILAFNNEDGEPEIISGHRRVYAARRLGILTVPVIIKKVTREEATFLMGVSNFTNRETILPSEKAFTFKAMMEAIQAKGRSTGEEHEKEERTRTILSKQTGVGSSQIQRLLRLTELIKELLDLVDRKELALRPAVELSYLDKDVQKRIYEIGRNEGAFPTTAVIREMRSLQEQGRLTEAEVKQTLSGQGEKGRVAPDMLAIHSRCLYALLKSIPSVLRREDRMLRGLQMVEEQEQKWRAEYEAEQKTKIREALQECEKEDSSNVRVEEDY